MAKNAAKPKSNLIDGWKSLLVSRFTLSLRLNLKSSLVLLPSLVMIQTLRRAL